MWIVAVVAGSREAGDNYNEGQVCRIPSKRGEWGAKNQIAKTAVY
jgi:hypothetical protein